jgi:transcriptional regulator with XRE-family HTH domain
VYYSIEVIYMDATMNIRDMRKQLGDTQSEFAERYNIPFRTVQNWETGMRKPPEYILELLKARIKEDLINKKALALPKYDSNKQDLPKRSDYVGATSWLKAVSESLGDEIVFALDEALMCSGSFGGRSDEFIIWIYGDDRLTRYNGVTVIGNYVSPINVREKNGLKFTDFNRTLSDAFANESILDMQGTIEALSRYYYSNGESFQGLSVAPEYQDRFDSLANEAIEYYDE